MTRTQERRVDRLADRLEREIKLALAEVAFENPEAQPILLKQRHNIGRQLADRIRDPMVARELARILKGVD